MRSIKRNLTAVAAAVLATGMLAACGAAEQAAPAGGSGGATAGGAAPRSMVFVQGVAGDEFYISMQCGIQAAAKAANITVDVQGPEKFDPTLQKPIVDSVVAKKPDALLVAPTDVTAMQAPLKAAADAGIKVVLVDTTLDDPSIAVSEIASDNEGGGKAAFDAIKQLNPSGGKVLVISVKPGISTTDARVKGFEDAVAADPSFQYLGVQFSNNEPSLGRPAGHRGAAEGPGHRRHLRHQPVLGRGLGHRPPAGRQAGPGQDRRLRRRPGPGQGAEGRHRAGADRPAAGQDR